VSQTVCIANEVQYRQIVPPLGSMPATTKRMQPMLIVHRTKPVKTVKRIEKTRTNLVSCGQYKQQKKRNVHNCGKSRHS
jgi:hypothetical protein